jgi:hypothetical protein
MGFCTFFSLLLHVHVTFASDKVMCNQTALLARSFCYTFDTPRHDGLSTLCARLLGAVASLKPVLHSRTFILTVFVPFIVTVATCRCYVAMGVANC